MKSARHLFLAIFALLSALALAEEEAAKSDAKKPAEQKEEPKKDEKPKEEKPKERTGKVTIAGQEISYLAQTGTMPLLKDDGAPRASVFYVYYAATDAEGKRLAAKDAATRPITFCFNGGPGSAAVWLHFGGLGPKKVQLDPEGLQPATRGAVVPNPQSILDVTDLVFIDPVGTGASRAAKGEKPEQFWGVNGDIESVGEFIRLFATREGRWASSKFLCGESYGGVRAAGLAEYLQSKHGFYVDGIVSISGVMNLGALWSQPLGLVNFLPALTATAHYHKKLPADLQADREKAIAESRAFAQSDYLTALHLGANLPADRRAQVAEKLARFTGLDRDLIERAHLQVTPALFYENLLRKEGKIIGRFDGRVTAEDYDRLSEMPEFDPSFTFILGPFSAAANASIRADLGYEFDQPYKILGGVNWSWKDFEGEPVNLEDRLAKAMKSNPRLRVLFCCGWRDLAVPPDSALYSISQLKIPESLRANLSVAYYESGHMMYLYQPDAEKLRKDLLEFMQAGRK